MLEAVKLTIILLSYTKVVYSFFCQYYQLLFVVYKGLPCYSLGENCLLLLTSRDSSWLICMCISICVHNKYECITDELVKMNITESYIKPSSTLKVCCNRKGVCRN